MATKKMKRFEVGGPSTEGGYTPGDTTEGMKEAYDRSQSDEDLSRGGVEPAKSESGPAKQTRGQAFNAARRRGDKIFEYEGKKYTTELASSKPNPKDAREEMDRTRARGMQAGYEESLGRGTMPAQAADPSAQVVPMAPAAAMASTTPRGVIPGTSAAEAMDMFRKARAARAAAANQVDPSQLRAEAAGRAAQARGVNGSAMDNFKQMMGMKSGGKVSSASSRGDGCAIRGKTRA